MKKLLLCSVAAAVLAFAACKKDSDKPTGPEKAPESYTQKIMVEYFSGAWCQYCPDGTVYSDNMTTKYGANNFYNVTIHYSDQMAFTEGLAINTAWNKAGYPTGMVNRTRGTSVSRSFWNPIADSIKNANPKARAGLSIDAKSGGNTIKVKVGIGNQDLDAGSYYLIVYGVTGEQSGSGTGWDQINAYNTVSGHPYYQKGNPILGYKHKNALNAVLTKDFGIKGQPLSADMVKAGALNEFSFNYDVAGKNGHDFSVIAFIYKDGTTTPGNQPYMVNVQKAMVGEAKSFD